MVSLLGLMMLGLMMLGLMQVPLQLAPVMLGFRLFVAGADDKSGRYIAPASGRHFGIPVGLQKGHPLPQGIFNLRDFSQRPPSSFCAYQHCIVDMPPTTQRKGPLFWLVKIRLWHICCGSGAAPLSCSHWYMYARILFSVSERMQSFRCRTISGISVRRRHMQSQLCCALKACRLSVLVPGPQL